MTKKLELRLLSVYKLNVMEQILGVKLKIFQGSPQIPNKNKVDTLTQPHLVSSTLPNEEVIWIEFDIGTAPACKGWQQWQPHQKVLLPGHLGSWFLECSLLLT